MIASYYEKEVGKKGITTLKLDMSKTYDRVEWRFLEGLMLKRCFHSMWVGSIMDCISTVTFLILINAHMLRKFSPHKVSGKVILYIFLYLSYMRKVYHC